MSPSRSVWLVTVAYFEVLEDGVICLVPIACLSISPQKFARQSLVLGSICVEQLQLVENVQERVLVDFRVLLPVGDVGNRRADFFDDVKSRVSHPDSVQGKILGEVR